jgi:hypothetical protein
MINFILFISGLTYKKIMKECVDNDGNEL